MKTESREDPLLWINRGKKDYFTAKETLCIFGAEPKGRVVPEISKVSMIWKGMLITLCKYIHQDAEQLLVPVNRDETAGWNVPLITLFKDAISNTALLFPPNIYDIKAASYIEYSPAAESGYDFDGTAPVQAAAESTDFYDIVSSASGSGLKLIITTSPLVGDTPLLYPGLMLTAGRAVDADPTVLVCEPGKFFVFDNPNLKEFEEYIDRYRKRFGPDSPDPRIYRYFRKNRILLNNSDMDSGKGPNIRKEAKIPRGSVISAWGDTEYRIELLEWKKNIGKPKEPLM